MGASDFSVNVAASSSPSVPESSSTAPPSAGITRTFFFTDIEGSTKLWDRHPEGMRTALGRHDEILQRTIEGNNGRVFKTIGDAFCAVFSEPTDALAAALQVQRALFAEPWGEVGALRVRMALHTGESESRSGDFFGLTVNRTARLLSAAHGGQVLLSQPTAELVRSRLPADITLKDLNEHRLKDLSRPERIFQVVLPDLPGEFPALRSLESFAHNLPVQLTSFIGREREVALVKERLGAVRLLSLVGAGGCGKSRLALQAAADMVEEFEHGVWLVELAPVSDPERLPQAIASVLGIREESGRSLSETLATTLYNRSLLLVLDNCEHLINACAALADRLLRSCPKVRILASSRQRLGVDGESTFPLPTLALPDPARLPSLEALRNFESVRLFQDRAAAGLPTFAVSSGNALAVAQICQRLDGIPLAIELAAARVKVLSPEQIVARLDDRFRLLTGGSRSALPRQQTLRALIDWSYDLLGAGERTLLRRLSVFSGGWTLEAAEAICADETTLESWEVLDHLSNLIDKSLVVVDDQSGDPRYRLLQTVRQYAAERLREAGEETVAARHRDWYLDLAEKAEVELRGAGQAEWLDRFAAENDNLRAALGHALRTAPAAGLRASGALWRFWTVRGHFAEGRDWLDRLLRAEAEEATRERATALRAAGALASNQGDYAAARELLTLSLGIWRSLGDRPGAAGTLNSLGNVAFLQGEYAAARALYEESLEVARERGDQRDRAVALISLGNVATQQGDYVRAAAIYADALGVVRQIGNREWEAATLQNLGDVAFNQKEYARAETLYNEAVEARRTLGDRRGVAVNLGKMGNVALRREDHNRAGALLEEALVEIRELGDPASEATILGDLGDLQVTAGKIDEAHSLHCRSLTLRRDLHNRWGIADSLRKLGSIACLNGNWTHAVRLFAAAEALREAIEVTIPPAELEEYEGNVAAARRALGDPTFTAAWQEGRAVPSEAAIAEALSPGGSL